jgi:hypothetical protein
MKTLTHFPPTPTPTPIPHQAPGLPLRHDLRHRYPAHRSESNAVRGAAGQEGEERDRVLRQHEAVHQRGVVPWPCTESSKGTMHSCLQVASHAHLLHLRRFHFARTFASTCPVFFPSGSAPPIPSAFLLLLLLWGFFDAFPFWNNDSRSPRCLPLPGILCPCPPTHPTHLLAPARCGMRTPVPGCMKMRACCQSTLALLLCVLHVGPVTPPCQVHPPFLSLPVTATGPEPSALRPAHCCLICILNRLFLRCIQSALLAESV